MKLKTSFFNPTLYKKNLTRFWPLWGLTSFFAALIPISGMMMHLNGDLHNMDPLHFARLYYSGAAYFAPVVMLCYCILCAMAVWSYLYNARSVGMMHSLPIRREGLFVTDFLSGLTMVAIPWAVVGVLCAILSLMCGAFSAGPLFLTILCVFAEGVFYFASATAAAFLTGNIFALPFLYFLFHFLAPLMDALITTFSANMIFGLQSRTYTGVVEWLSPTVEIINKVKVNSVYTEIPMEGHPNVTESVLSGVTLENAWIIGVYALVGLALLGVAYALYRYRQSECAGEVIAMRWGRPVFRYGISALAALGGGQLLYVIIFNTFDLDANSYRILPLIFCMLIAGLIGYYGASMLLEKTLRVFKGSLRGVGIVAAGCVVICCAVGFDLFGVARRVPSVEQVKYVRLYCANNTYYLFPDEDAEVMEQLRDVHHAIIADKDYIEDQLRTYYTGWKTDFTQHTFAQFRVTYYLKGGLTVERNYNLPLSKDRMGEPETFDYALDRFINSTDMRLRRLRFNDPRFEVESGNITVQKRDDGFEFSSRELKTVLNAIAEDAKTGTWGEYAWFDEDDSTYAVQMFFWYQIRGLEEQTGRGMDGITVYLRPGMDRTISALKTLGYLEDGDLITAAEMRKIWEERDAKYNVPDTAEAIEPEAVTDTALATVPETVSPDTVPATVPDGTNNPNSAPQTPVESSAASSAG